MREYSYYVYIIASKKRGTIYIGMTSTLMKRVLQHKLGYFSGFTKKYKVHKLVWFEDTNDVHTTLLREKQFKKWNRAWKIRLIEENNPNWNDLSKDWFSEKDVEKYKQDLER